MFGAPDLSGTFQVDAAGDLSMPLHTTIDYDGKKVEGKLVPRPIEDEAQVDGEQQGAAHVAERPAAAGDGVPVVGPGEDYADVELPPAPGDAAEAEPDVEIETEE